MADGWGCIPALLVVWPQVSQHWSLQAVGWGQVLVSKWWSPGQLTPLRTTQNLHHHCPCPHSEPQLPPTTPEGSPRPSGWSGPGSYEVNALSLGPGAHETLCAPFKNDISVSPIPVEFLRSSPTGLQSQMLWGLLLTMPEPPTGEPDMGLKMLTPVEEPL